LSNLAALFRGNILAIEDDTADAICSIPKHARPTSDLPPADEAGKTHNFAARTASDTSLTERSAW